MKIPKRLLIVSLCAGVLVGAYACTPSPQEAPETASEAAPSSIDNPLYVDPASRDFSANPKLLDRILETPHGYFRFINVPFSQEACRRFSPDLTATSTLNLHGDAHMEQYAITDLGRGLTDFDDSSTGPGVLDLARFGVSMLLAGRQVGLEAEADAAFNDLLRGYTDGLTGVTDEAKPDLANRKEAEFRDDKEGFFNFVEGIMEPVPDDERAELLVSLEDYFAAMRAANPDYGDAYFNIVDLGYLRQGIGSALDLKFLIRIQGPSDAPTDDVVLELKEVRDLTSIDCIRVSRGDDPFRVLQGHARIANEPFRYLGYSRFRDVTFWIHAWVENYSELDIADDLKTGDFAQVAYDAGLQLGRGQVRKIAEPVEQQLRSEQSRLIAENAERIQSECRELANLAVDAWEEFRARAQTGASP